MSHTFTIPTSQEIEGMVKDIMSGELSVIYKEFAKLKLRINDLEQVLRIYDGKLKVVPKNKA